VLSEGVRRVFVFEYAFLKKILDEPVFQGMKSDNGDAAAGRKETGCLLQHLLQRTQFVIDFDSQGLEYLGEVLVWVSFHDPRERRFKIRDRLHRYGAAQLYDGPGQGFGVGDFSILLEQLMQLLFGPAVDHFIGRHGLPLIHSHVHIAFEPEGEASVCFVELVAADS